MPRSCCLMQQRDGRHGGNPAAPACAPKVCQGQGNAAEGGNDPDPRVRVQRQTEDVEPSLADVEGDCPGRNAAGSRQAGSAEPLASPPDQERPGRPCRNRRCPRRSSRPDSDPPALAPWVEVSVGHIYKQERGHCPAFQVSDNVLSLTWSLSRWERGQPSDCYSMTSAAVKTSWPGGVLLEYFRRHLHTARTG